MAELRALRELVAPQPGMAREDAERSRALMAEAQAYKQELLTIGQALRDTCEAFAGDTPGAPDAAEISRVARELAAITAGTEQATQAILKAAEDIDNAAGTLAAAAKGSHETGLAQDIQERVVAIFESCNFQDITGQRVARTATALRKLEERLQRLDRIWRSIEAFAPAVVDEPRRDDRRFLNGPGLAGETGHASQSDVDLIFRSA